MAQMVSFQSWLGIPTSLKINKRVVYPLRFGLGALFVHLFGSQAHTNKLDYVSHHAPPPEVLF